MKYISGPFVISNSLISNVSVRYQVLGMQTSIQKPVKHL